MGTGEVIAEGNPAMDWHPIQWGVEILVVASCCRNQDKLWPDGPLLNLLTVLVSSSNLASFYFTGMQ